MKKKIIGALLASSVILTGGISATGCTEDNIIWVNDTLSLTEAIAEAKETSIIKLEKDIVLNEQIDINKKIIIDLNKFTISNTEDIWNTKNGAKDWSLLSVQEGGDLTIKNGTLKAKENDCYAIDVRAEEAKLTIESGTYIGNAHTIYVHTGMAYIKGGTFDIQQLSPETGDSRYTLNCLDANHKNDTANIIVSGGTFANYNPAGSTSENPTANFLAEGYTVEFSDADSNGDVWSTVVLIEE